MIHTREFRMEKMSLDFNNFSHVLIETKSNEAMVNNPNRKYFEELIKLRNKELFNQSTSTKRILVIGVLLFALLLLLTMNVFAVEQLVSLQGKITDSNGNLISRGNVSVTIWDSATSGALVYNSTNDFNYNITNGFFDIMLGSVTTLNLNLSQTYYMDLQINDQDIDWDGQERRQFQSPVEYQVSGIENFTIDTNVLYVDTQNNKVGIGTSSPDTAFKTVGDINITGTVWSLGMNITAGGLGAAGGWTDDGSLIRLTTSSDNVGIGVSSTTQKLHVDGNTTITGSLYLGGNLLATNIGDSSGVSAFGWSKSGTVVSLANPSDYVGVGTTAPSSKLVVLGNVSINNSDGASRLWVDVSSGNVGIGTASPGAALHVGTGAVLTTQNGAGTTVTGQIQNSQTSGTAAITAAVYDGTNNRRIALFADQTNGIVGLSSSYSSVAPDFVIRDAGGERLRISSSGSVGIGTMGPTANLHINATGPVIILQDSDSTENTHVGYISLRNSSNVENGWLGFGYGNIDAIGIANSYAGGAIVLTPGSGGAVGIKDATPDYGLDVVDDINSDDCFREAGAQVAGTCASDERLKKNIHPLNNSLNQIMQLKPVEFEWKEGIDKLGGTIRYVEGRQVGLIAQDVQKVLPHLVEEKNGYLSVEYNLEMQMMLINAMQELKAENEDLKQRVEALEKTNGK